MEIQKYKESKLYVDLFERHISDKTLKDKTCISCKERKITRKLNERVDPTNQNGANWEGGSVFKVCNHANESESFFAAICDHCMYHEQQDGRLESVQSISLILNTYKNIK